MSRTSDPPTEMTPSQIEMARLYWEEVSYRHNHYWDVFFKSSFAILFVLAVPYAFADKINQLAGVVLVFPITAIFLTLLASWILAAEYSRLKATIEKYNELRAAPYDRKDFGDQGVGKGLKGLIGWVATTAFLVGFLAISLFELFLVSRSG